MNFEKWQALGNDYLIVERDQLPFELTAKRVRLLCARNFGVSADGVLLLARSADPEIVADLRIYNPDGSEAELSGNGAREAILYLRHRGWTDREVFSIQTAAGVVTPTIIGPTTCRVDMGKAVLTSKDFPTGPPDGRGRLTADGHEWDFQHVSIGNPQCAICLRDAMELGRLDIETVGRAIERHELFPNRTNVSWYIKIPPTESDPNRIRALIFERGVGQTWSSGTGAIGAAVAHYLSGGAELGHVVTVGLPGGELEVEVGEHLHINLTGEAHPVFKGTLSDDFLKELDETQ
ncbi:MAG TPA: diaminopimelate epimerase [Solirubrobacteraceae bacterium]|nr:diaminopimelate epimerase [Solirubrobacteraceae bacterium]